MNPAPAKDRLISDPRPLTRDDMARISLPAFQPRVLSADTLRHAHHRVARLAAAGLRNFEICERTKYSPGRITVLLNSPAMKELIAYYRSLVIDKFVDSTDEYTSVASENMMRAESLLADRLDQAELGDPLSVKDLLAIASDRADRFGYGKHSSKTELRMDFATQLEAARRRSAIAQRKEDA